MTAAEQAPHPRAGPAQAASNQPVSSSVEIDKTPQFHWVDIDPLPPSPLYSNRRRALKCEWPQQDGVPLEPFTGDFSPPTSVTDELSLLAPISASQDIFPSRWFRWKPPPAHDADPRIVPPRATTRLSVHAEHGLAIHEGFTYHAVILLTWWH